MESLGKYLRENREAKGMTLEQIAETTRIPLSSLECLEADQLETLPGEIFIRGFIRSYCKVIGIEPNHALSLFHDGRQSPEPTDIGTREYKGIIFNDEQQSEGMGLRLSHLILILIAIVTFVIAFMAVGSEREKETLSSQKLIHKIDKNRR